MQNSRTIAAILLLLAIAGPAGADGPLPPGFAEADDEGEIRRMREQRIVETESMRSVQERLESSSILLTGSIRSTWVVEEPLSPAPGDLGQFNYATFDVGCASESTSGRLTVRWASRSELDELDALRGQTLLVAGKLRPRDGVLVAHWIGRTDSEGQTAVIADETVQLSRRLGNCSRKEFQP